MPLSKKGVVAVVQKTLQGKATEVKSDADKLLRRREFVLLPELKIPGKAQAQTAVAAEPVWQWSAVGDETLHPF